MSYGNGHELTTLEVIITYYICVCKPMQPNALI